MKAVQANKIPKRLSLWPFKSYFLVVFALQITEYLKLKIWSKSKSASLCKTLEKNIYQGMKTFLTAHVDILMVLCHYSTWLDAHVENHKHACFPVQTSADVPNYASGYSHQCFRRLQLASVGDHAKGKNPLNTYMLIAYNYADSNHYISWLV